MSHATETIRGPVSKGNSDERENRAACKVLYAASRNSSESQCDDIRTVRTSGHALSLQHLRTCSSDESLVERRFDNTRQISASPSVQGRALRLIIRVFKMRIRVWLLTLEVEATGHCCGKIFTLAGHEGRALDRRLLADATGDTVARGRTPSAR
jgi:hypothetical protein